MNETVCRISHFLMTLVLCLIFQFHLAAIYCGIRNCGRHLDRQIRWKKNAQRMESLRTKLLQNLVEGIGDDVVKPNGPSDACKRLPNTLSVGLRNVQSGELLQEIQMRVACSAGSACHSSGGKLSPVLEAMKVPMEFARGTLRLSVGPDTTQDDVDTAAKIIIKEVKRQLDAL